jgi:hypothetical protein
MIKYVIALKYLHPIDILLILKAGLILQL